MDEHNVAARPTSPAAVACTQHVYAWAQTTLSGTQGFGLVGRPADAPLPLGGAGTFLAPERIAAATQAPYTATAVEYQRVPDGARVRISKDLGADLGGRPGRRVTQVLQDDSGRLDGLSVLLAVPRLLDDLDWPADGTPDEDLPPVRIPLVGLQEDGGGADVPDPVPDPVLDAVMFAALDRGRPTVILGVDRELVLPALVAVWALLPVRARSDVSFATFIGSSENCEVDVAFASPLSVVRPGANKDVRYLDVNDLEEQAAGLARALAQMSPGQRERVHTMEDVRAWARVRGVVEGLRAYRPGQDVLREATALWSELDRESRELVLAHLVAAASAWGTSEAAALAGALPGADRARVAHAAQAAAVARMCQGEPPQQVAAIARSWGVDDVAIAEEVLERLLGDGDAPGPVPPELVPAAQWLVNRGVVPTAVALAWCEDPAIRELVLARWGHAAVQVAERMWLEPGWAQDHVLMVGDVVGRFPDRALEVFESLRARGRLRREQVGLAIGHSGDAALALAQIAARSSVLAPARASARAGAPVQSPAPAPLMGALPVPPQPVPTPPRLNQPSDDDMWRPADEESARRGRRWRAAAQSMLGVLGAVVACTSLVLAITATALWVAAASGAVALVAAGFVGALVARARTCTDRSTR